MEINSKIENLFKNVPAFSIGVIVLSYLNQYLYYFYFGIPIYNYLDATEIIFSFSSLIPAVFLGVLMYAFMTFQDYYFRKEREERMQKILERIEKQRLEDEQKKLNPSVKKDKFWERALQWIFSTTPRKYHQAAKWLILIPVVAVQFVLVMSFVITICFILPAMLFDTIVLLDFHSEYVFYVAFLLVFLMVATFAKKGTRLTTMIYLGLIVLFISYRTRASYNAVISSNPKYKMELMLANGEIIKSDTTELVHIGSTRNYHFFYQPKKKKSTRVIPNAEVQDVTITELRTGL